MTRNLGTGSPTPPELDFVELRRARRLRDRLRAVAAGPAEGPATLLVWLRRSLLFLSLICLGIYGFATAEQLWADHRSRAWLAAQSDRPSDAASAPSPAVPSSDAEEPGPPPTPAVSDLAAGDPVGRLAIPALGVEGAVQHGNTSTVLRRAIGHLPGTALPGEGGHVVLAGHRDSFFRELRRAHRGQEITLRTPGGEHVYRIDGLRIVGPRDVEVIAPTDSERLTLITCYPFDYVGAAPRRFIVTARPATPRTPATGPPSLGHNS